MECELRGRKIKLEENGDLYWFSPRGKLLKYKQTKTQITKRNKKQYLRIYVMVYYWCIFYMTHQLYPDLDLATININANKRIIATVEGKGGSVVGGEGRVKADINRGKLRTLARHHNRVG